MKYFSKIILPALAAVTMLAACDKVDDLPYYTTGSAPTLTVANAAIAPLPADSNNVVLNLSWTDPSFATDSVNYKYIIQIDSTTRNFSKAITKTIYTTRSASFTAKELNNTLIGWGFAFNRAYDLDVRIVASYANNNDQKISNVVKINFKTYAVPPKVAPPVTGRLFLVGSATQGGWNNPVPTPSQEFGKIDSVTYVGVFQLNGSSEYLMLPANGDWSNKYSVANNTVAGLNAGGNFGFNLSDNFPGPTAAGMYKILVNFQTGKFTVTPYNGPSLPTNLFLVGSATPGGWNNPVPTPSQQFTRLNSVEIELTVALSAAGEYLVLPVNGDWGNKYAVPNNTLSGLSAGGYFGYNLGDNFPGPSTGGNYKIYLNFGMDDGAGTANRAYFKTTKL